MISAEMRPVSVCCLHACRVIFYAGTIKLAAESTPHSLIGLLEVSSAGVTRLGFIWNKKNSGSLIVLRHQKEFTDVLNLDLRLYQGLDLGSKCRHYPVLARRDSVACRTHGLNESTRDTRMELPCCAPVPEDPDRMTIFLSYGGHRQLTLVIVPRVLLVFFSSSIVFSGVSSPLGLKKVCFLEAMCSPMVGRAREVIWYSSGYWLSFQEDQENGSGR